MDKATLNRLALFAVVALAVAALDLATKSWASRNLARVDHPISMVVDSQGSGKTLAALLEAKGHAQADLDDVMKLEPGLQPAADGLFPLERVTRDLGYYLYLSDDRSEPPLFIPNPTHAQRRAKGSAFDLGAWLSEAKAADLKTAALIAESATFLSQEQAEELLAKGLMHPISRGGAALSGQQTVQEGDVFLLTQRQIELIPNLLRFVYAENPGAAWGFLGQAPLLVRKVVLQAFSFLAMILLAYVVWRDKTAGWKLNSAALALIMGGAVGNFVDRIGRDVVVDFIDMYIGDNHWPTYNVADIGITFGVGLLIIQMLRKKSPF